MPSRSLTYTRVLLAHSLIPRSLPDFIQFLPQLQDKIWEWPGNEATLTTRSNDFIRRHVEHMMGWESP